jgi:hypothetical protein
MSVVHITISSRDRPARLSGDLTANSGCTWMAISENELDDAHKRRVAGLHAVRIDAELRQGTLPKHVFWARVYRNAAFLRLKALEKATANNLQNDFPVAAVILARQFVETAAHYISTTLYIEKQLRKSPPDLKRIDERIGRSFMGTKLPTVTDQFTAEQVMNCLDDCDAYIRKLMPEIAAKERRPVRSAYEFTSEFTHPNAFAFQYHVALDGKGADTTARFVAHNELAHTLPPRVRRELIIIDILLLRDREFMGLLASPARRGAR